MAVDAGQTFDGFLQCQPQLRMGCFLFRITPLVSAGVHAKSSLILDLLA